jgi:chromosome segregation ATPase
VGAVTTQSQREFRKFIEVKTMRKRIWLATLLVALGAAQLCSAQQASQSAKPPQSSQASANKQTAAPAKTPTQAGQQVTVTKTDSLADAARKAREAQKNAPKAKMVFTNDNIPTSSSGVSVVGASASDSEKPANSDAAAAAGQDKNDEAMWRQKFADARHKIDQDKQELSIMQRELGELNVQYYSDPTQQMQQDYSRSDINNKQNAIDAKQKELAADEQALSDLEDELRKAGGDPAWARE